MHKENINILSKNNGNKNNGNNFVLIFLHQVLSLTYITRVPYHNGISRLYNMLEIYHSGPEPNPFSSLTLGEKRWNSLYQLGRVERGAQIKKGPGTPMYTMCDSMATHCTVFPKPISSARIPFTPFS